MSKAIFYNTPLHGHINPSLPLAAELVSRGEQVIYYSTSEFRTKIEATGAEYRAYEHWPYQGEDLGGAEPGLGAALALLKASQLMLPILLEQARSEQPDYILFDAMTVWGWQIATALDVPSVSSSATFAFSPQVMFAIQPRVMMTVLSTMFGGMKYVGPYSQIAKQIKAQHGVKSPPIGQALANPGTLNIIYTTKELQPAANTFKDNFLFIGPSIALRNDSAEFPLDELIGEQVIYISLGTVFNKSLDFYRECIKAFAVSPYKVVMSVGKSTNIANLGTLPPNFIVRNYVPQLDVLQRSDLFITHAGMGSVHEGLYYGVPMILVPQIFEQEIVASQITKAGAGVVLSKSKGSHDKILSMAETILKNSKYRSASQQLGTALKQAGGTSHAADAILGLGKRHSCG